MKMEKVPKSKRTNWKLIDPKKLGEVRCTPGGNLIYTNNKGGFNYYGSHGQSTATIVCGFCENSQGVFVWSLAGSGKRCGRCNSLITSGMTFACYEETIPKEIQDLIIIP